MTEQATIGELAAATAALPADYFGAHSTAYVEGDGDPEESALSTLGRGRRAGSKRSRPSDPGWRNWPPKVMFAWLTEAVGVPRLEFRHDRIVEYCLSKTIATIFIIEADDREAVTDPFFIPFVGSPRSLGEPARCGVGVDPPAESRRPDRGRAVSDSRRIGIRRWGRPTRPCMAQPARRLSRLDAGYDALGTLARSSSSRVLDVTEGMPGNQRVWEARLRNE